MKASLKLRISSPLSHLYDEARLAAITRRSLNLMLLANLFGNLYTIICGGGTTAMIGLANILGAGDFAFGVLNGLPQAAALLQIPFSLLVNRTHKRKRMMMTYGLVSRALWLLFGLIPLFVPQNPEGLRLWTLIFLLGISSCCGAAINVCWFPWFSDLAPARIRGRWFSIRDMIVSACNIGFGFLVAYLLDTLEPSIRYVLIFLLGGTVGMLDMLCFAFCEERYSVPPQRLKLKEVIGGTFKDRPFMRLTIMWTAWCFTANMGGAYLGRYSTNEMGLSFMQLMVFGTMTASIATIAAMPVWGRALEKYRRRNVMLLACLGAALADAAYLFSTPGSIVPVLLRNFFGALFWSGANLTTNCLQLSCSPEDARPSYIAIFSCITALVGTTLGMLAGGALLESVENVPLPGGLDKYKALFLLAMALRLMITLVFVPKIEDGSEAARQ